MSLRGVHEITSGPFVTTPTPTSLKAIARHAHPALHQHTRTAAHHHLGRAPLPIDPNGLRPHAQRTRWMTKAHRVTLPARPGSTKPLLIAKALTAAVKAKRREKLPVVLTTDETATMLSAVDGIYYLLFALMYGCGLRAVEVVRLRVQDIDFGYQVCFRQRSLSALGAKRFGYMCRRGRVCRWKA